MSRPRLLVLAWVLGWGLVSSLWCITSAWQLSATADETFYADGGLKFWQHGSHKYLIQAGTMPLPLETTGFFLFAAEQLGLTASAVDELETWLPWARLGTLLFWWLLLGSAYVLARWHGGTVAGCLAVALLACEPTMLAHAGLATTDVALTACLTALMAAHLTGRQSPVWWRRVGLPALLLALTFLSKASALVFVPLCLLAAEGWWLIQSRPARGGRKPPEASPPRDRRLSSGGLRPPLAGLNSLLHLLQISALGLGLMLLICPMAYKGIWIQVRHNGGGSGPVFLLGEVSGNGYWYYFLATLIIKLSLPLLLLFAGVLLWRPRRLLTAPVLAGVGILALSPWFRVQLGIRIILPVVALLIVGLSIALGQAFREMPLPRHRWLLAPVAALLALGLGNALAIWPHGLCYTNALWGGTSRGYLALDGANYDWGQGLWELRAWQQRAGAVEMDLWYSGPEPMLKFVPQMRPVQLAAASPSEMLEQSRGRLLAVSLTHLYGATYHHPLVEALRRRTPVARTTTFFIYDLRSADCHVSCR